MTLISMTGFGESSGLLDLSDGGQIGLNVICKSVNHRFLDLSIKLPSKISHLDNSLQKIIRSLLSRGRVEVFVSREVIGQTNKLVLNIEALTSAMEDLAKVEIKGIKKDDLSKIVLSAIMNRKEILDLGVKESESESEAGFVEKLLLEAINNLIESRKTEGARLAVEIDSILFEMNERAKKIDLISSKAPEVLKERFNERLSQLYSSYSPDDQRMLQEIAILSDKVDVREEIVRLNSHLKHFDEVKNEGGRKLEFIVQEMGREINTIGSKTSQYEVSALVIELKSLLEKLREQLMNVE